MAKGVQHYYKDGRKYNGDTHKMPNGTVHTGKTHTKGSKVVVHFKDLSVSAKKRAKGSKVLSRKKK
tara:strand:+ start:182 stop:379 length:198 start_codon:yes stop_codon:yes gene_type:complete